jgi:hypothetical protein
VKLRGGEVENPPRNAGAARVEKLPCDAERWARTGSTKPAATSVTSATTKRRFMGFSLRLIFKVKLKEDCGAVRGRRPVLLASQGSLED